MRLTEGETLLLDLRAHPKALLLPVLVLLLVLGATGYGVALLEDPLGRLGVVAVALLLLVRLSLVPFLRWRAARFVLTDERLVLREGVLRRSGRDVPLTRVDEVVFRQSLLQRLQGCGTLDVAAGDADSLVVRDLRDVEAVQHAVSRAVDAARGR